VARDYFARMIESAVTRMSKDGPYLLGPQFSGVDILMTSCLDIAERYDLRVPERFKHYRERVSQRPAYATATAANTPQ
ncbi:MAG: glutathione binding-like protein, partial [Pseudomonadota bacterium]|nr:glutathione binding-like protein [Pseudomonadota bacterium]